MSTESCISHLVCSQTGEKLAYDELQTFSPANKPLLAVYDLEQAAARLSKEALQTREHTLWRYRELLPVLSTGNIISLGEGDTPLVPLSQAGAKLNMKQIWVKDEGQMPTGSFKARGLAMAVSKAHELGVKQVAVPTAGNAGGALAAYAARAGMECFIFMPKDVPRINYMEAKLTGANVTLVDGIISDCGKMLAEQKEKHGWFDVSTLKEPYRLEGKKTMGLELAEQFRWELPDVIFYPTGGGTGLIGMWKAFSELRQMGWIGEHLPRMVAVQAEGCEPITRAFKAGSDESEFFDDAETIASGLRVPKAFGDALILKALRESGGLAVSVSDEAILEAVRELAELEGMVVCPEGGATWAALKQLVATGQVGRDERVVLFNTGSGLKYPEMLETLT